MRPLRPKRGVFSARSASAKRASPCSVVTIRVAVAGALSWTSTPVGTTGRPGPSPAAFLANAFLAAAFFAAAFLATAFFSAAALRMSRLSACQEFGPVTRSAGRNRTPSTWTISPLGSTATRPPHEVGSASPTPSKQPDSHGIRLERPEASSPTRPPAGSARPTPRAGPARSTTRATRARSPRRPETCALGPPPAKKMHPRRPTRLCYSPRAGRVQESQVVCRVRRVRDDAPVFHLPGRWPDVCGKEVRRCGLDAPYETTTDPRIGIRGSGYTPRSIREWSGRERSARPSGTETRGRRIVGTLSH